MIFLVFLPNTYAKIFSERVFGQRTFKRSSITAYSIRIIVKLKQKTKKTSGMTDTIDSFLFLLSLLHFGYCIF